MDSGINGDAANVMQGTEIQNQHHLGMHTPFVNYAKARMLETYGSAFAIFINCGGFLQL